MALIEEAIGYPCFVKPANGGSSVGVTKVRSREDFDGALRSAFSFGDKVLVEELIDGREVECGILGNRAPDASPVGEIVTNSEFYDYNAKYLDDNAQIIVPADIPAATATALREA